MPSRGYSLRSDGYALRSKGVSFRPFEIPKTNKFKSRSGGTISPTKVSCSQNKTETNKQKKMDREAIFFRSGRTISPSKVSSSQNETITNKQETMDLEAIYFGNSESLATQAHEFATAALAYLTEKGSKLTMVKPCLYQVGNCARFFIIHTNFQAKRADDPGSSVCTYFAQLRYDGASITSVDCCVNLGKSASLPDRRDNRGCLFCSTLVHHPIGGCEGIELGWPNWESLESEEDTEESSDDETEGETEGVSFHPFEIPKTNKFKSKSGGPISPNKVSFSQNKTKTNKQEKMDPEDIYFPQSEPLATKARKFATAAMAYLTEKGFKLTLVKPCLYQVGNCSRSLIIHTNFQARKTGHPGSPVYTYFAQLRYVGESVTSVDCCVNLGKSDSLPDRRDNRGCLFCSTLVHHPIGGCEGIKLGWPNWESLESEEDTE